MYLCGGPCGVGLTLCHELAGMACRSCGNALGVLSALFDLATFVWQADMRVCIGMHACNVNACRHA